MVLIEWTINNFSCWNVHVHEKHIEFRTSFSLCPRVILYPRGLQGIDEHLVVIVGGLTNVYPELHGQLSCMDSSGSLLCIQEISDEEKKGDFYEVFLKLKFADVAAKIRRNEILHQDQFILRVDLIEDMDRWYRFSTTIEVFDTCVEITPKVSEGQRECFISCIEFPFEGYEKGSLCFDLIRDKNKLLIRPESVRKNFQIFTSLFILKLDSVTRMEKNKHVFQNKEKWTFVNSLTEEELKEGSLLLLRLKITPGNKYKHQYGYFSKFTKAVDVFPTNITTLSKTLKSLNEFENSDKVLSKEFLRLYQNHEFSDFQLLCKEVSFPTHKSILSARSPVFKAMFSSDMKESSSNSTVVSDLDSHTLGRFLVFLYTGTVDELQWEEALKLYYAADKYQVPSLKRECSMVLEKNVSVSNVWEILSLADKHQDEKLTKEAHAFISNNYNDVLRSDEWQTFTENESSLAVKTLTCLARQNTFLII